MTTDRCLHCSQMYVFAVATITVNAHEAMHGPGFDTVHTTLAHEAGTTNEGSAIEDQTSAYSYGESVGYGKIASLLEEQVTNPSTSYERIPSYMNDTREGNTELNDSSAFRQDYVTNTEQLATTENDNHYTKHTSGSQTASGNVTDTINIQHDILSENPRNFGNSNSRNFGVPMGEYQDQDINSELSYKHTTNVIIPSQESEQTETETEYHQYITFNTTNNTHQTNVEQKIFELFESSADHEATDSEGLSKLLRYEEQELKKTADNAWNYTEHFLSSGDLEFGQEAINLMQNYVQDRRRWMRHMQLNSSDNQNTSDEWLSREPSFWVSVTQLNNVETTLHNLQHIYRLATVVTTNEIRFLNYSATHNYSADLSFVLEAEKYLNDLEISIRDMEEKWHEYGLTENFAFPWNRSLQLVLERSYLREMNKSIHEANLLALKKKLEHTFQYYIYPGFYFVLLVLGATGNGALLLMFVKYKEIRTAPNIMVFNLALVDIMNLFANAPLYYISKYHSQWLYLEGYGCRLFATFRFLNHSIIEFSVVGLSAQRYCATVTTLRNRTSRWRLSARCKTVTFLLVVWLIALVVSLPPSLLYEFPSGVCFPLATSLTKVLNVFYFVLYCIVLPLTMGVFSVTTARKLKQSVRNIPGEQQYRSQEVTRYRSAKVVTALAISYAVTHIPRSVWFFCVSFFHLDRLETKYIYIDEITNYLIFANSCLNPMALYVSSGKFRQLFRRHLFCVRRKDKGCASLERRATASSSTRLVYLSESYAGDMAGHKTSLKGLNNFMRQSDAHVNINPSTQ